MLANEHIKIYYCDEQKMFFAEIPNLKGCVAKGKSFDEAIRLVMDLKKRLQSLAKTSSESFII